MFKHILSQILIAIIAIATTLMITDEFDWDKFLISSFTAILVIPITIIIISYARERKKSVDKTPQL